MSVSDYIVRVARAQSTINAASSRASSGPTNGSTSWVIQAWKCSHSRLYWLTYDGMTIRSAWAGPGSSQPISFRARSCGGRGDGDDSIPWIRTVVAADISNGWPKVMVT